MDHDEKHIMVDSVTGFGKIHRQSHSAAGRFRLVETLSNLMRQGEKCRSGGVLFAVAVLSVDHREVTLKGWQKEPLQIFGGLAQ